MHLEGPDFKHRHWDGQQTKVFRGLLSPSMQTLGRQIKSGYDSFLTIPVQNILYCATGRDVFPAVESIVKWITNRQEVLLRKIFFFQWLDSPFGA
jgi:hypothetical protein